MFTSKKIRTVGTVKEFLKGQEKKIEQDWVPLAAAGSALPLILNTMPTFSFAATNTSVDVSQKLFLHLIH